MNENTNEAQENLTRALAEWQTQPPMMADTKPETPAPSLLDAAKAIEKFWGAWNPGMPLSSDALKAMISAAIAAEERANPCGVSPRESPHRAGSDPPSSPRAENAELRAEGERMLRLLRSAESCIPEANIDTFEAILAKAKGETK